MGNGSLPPSCWPASSQHSVGARHLFTRSSRFGFSTASPLLVVQLFVHRLLRGVAPLAQLNLNLEPRGQHAHDLGADAQADERGHGAVSDRRGEPDLDLAAAVVYVDLLVGHHAQLLQRIRVLRVRDVTNVFEVLYVVDSPKILGGCSGPAPLAGTPAGTSSSSSRFPSPSRPSSGCLAPRCHTLLWSTSPLDHSAPSLSLPPRPRAALRSPFRSAPRPPALRTGLLLD